MGFRFRRSVSLLPGIRLNFSTRGVSTSVGGRGFTLNFGKRGVRTTVGIPGTGISYSEMLTRNSNGDSGAANDTPPAEGSSIGCGTAVFIVLAVVVLARVLGGPEAENSGGTSMPSESMAPAPLVVPTGVVTAKILKCRAAPNTKAGVLLRLPRGTRVQQLENQQDWVRVTEIASGNPPKPANSCWVAERFLRPN
jgi:Protein of unknown function (DUF4236)